MKVVGDPVHERRHSRVHSGVRVLGAADSPADNADLSPRISVFDDQRAATVSLLLSSYEPNSFGYV